MFSITVYGTGRTKWSILCTHSGKAGWVGGSQTVTLLMTYNRVCGKSLWVANIHRESRYTAGVMLAHLHQLQSENRRMQTRIMELASQREFYIATNTRLHQTLTEHDLASGNKLTNGVRTLGVGSLRGEQGVQSNSTQVSPVSSMQSNGESQQLGTKSAVRAVPDSAAVVQALDVNNGGAASVEMAVRKMASHGRLLLEQPQGNTLADIEHLAASSGNTTGGRGMTMQGAPDVTHVTDSIQTPISTFAALPVGTVPMWCD